TLSFDVADEDRNEAIALREVARNAVQKLPGKIDVIERHPGNAELEAQRLGELRLGHPSSVEKHLTELFSLFPRSAEDLAELLRRDHPALDEKLAQKNTGTPLRHVPILHG